MSKVTLEMYTSEECPDLYFDCEEDANAFDEAIRNYVKNEECIKDFEHAMDGIPSWGAVNYYINEECTFHLRLTEVSDDLIEKLENCIDTTDNADYYAIAMNYILYKLHPELIGKLC